MKPQLKGNLLVLSGAVFWGTTGTSQALISGPADPLSVGAVRVISAAVFLFIFNFLFKIKFESDLLKVKDTWFSAVSLVLYQIFFFTGVKMTGIAVGTVLMLGSSTVFAGLLAALIIGEKPEKKWYLASLMSVAGCVILVAGTGLELNVCGAFFFSVFQVCPTVFFPVFSKKVLAKYSSPVFIMTVFLISAFLSVPVLIMRPAVWIMSGSGLAIALYLGFFCNSSSILPLHRRIKAYKGINSSNSGSGCEPATASLLGVFFIGEKLSLYSFSGIVIIFAGPCLSIIA